MTTAGTLDFERTFIVERGGDTLQQRDEFEIVIEEIANLVILGLASPVIMSTMERKNQDGTSGKVRVIFGCPGQKNAAIQGMQGDMESALECIRTASENWRKVLDKTERKQVFRVETYSATPTMIKAGGTNEDMGLEHAAYFEAINLTMLGQTQS